MKVWCIEISRDWWHISGTSSYTIKWHSQPPIPAKENEEKTKPRVLASSCLTPRKTWSSPRGPLDPAPSALSPTALTSSHSHLAHSAPASLAAGWSSNNSGTLLPQGLCTGCSLCLELPSLGIHLKKLPLSNLHSYVIFLGRRSPTMLFKKYPKLSTPQFFVFLPHSAHSLVH